MAELSALSVLTPDVLVVGGGMAGVMAALAAKTPGHRVLVVEPANILGGQGTVGGVAGFCGDTARVNAPFAELVERLTRHGLIEPYRPNNDRRAYDLEWCAFFLQEMVVGAGIDVLFHSRVIAASAVAGRVTELTLASAGGLHHVRPRIVIDASGACVVPVLAGFPVMHEGANRQLPMSLYFTLWDTGRPVTPILPEGCPRWRDDREIPMTSLHRFPSGKVEVKMKVVGFDAADGLSRSAAEVFARRQMHGLIYYLQTVGYRGRRLDTHVLASVSRAIGVREERRIVGEHVLTEAEVRREVIFPDVVAVNTYHIDFHWPDRAERAGTGITDQLDPHHLPLRMMIPRGARNLIVPGRGASADQTAMSAFRVMAVVAQMGFAAGHAARLALACGCDWNGLDMTALQAALEADGQSLNLSDYGDYLRYDRLVDEPITNAPAPSGAVRELVIMALPNAGFRVSWCDDAGGHALERREKRWAPVEPEAGDYARPPMNARTTAIRMDDSRLARVGVQADGLRSELSADGGASWFMGTDLVVGGVAGVTPAAVATRTGLAVAYVTMAGGLRFWHGSVERLAGEALVPSALRLDSPPDDVHEAPLLRA